MLRPSLDIQEGREWVGLTPHFPLQGADVLVRSLLLCLTVADTPPFPSCVTAQYRPAHEDMEETPRRPGEDHHRQLRRAHGHGREQRVLEDRGLPGRVAQ